ncbi:MAG: serine dehydratase beta chain, partial [Pseudomonadota bacterium]
MPALSVFDMLKVGVGPSSSHTLGPWRAVQRWLGELAEEMPLHTVERVHIDLYGSLALTGRGHCTDQALC